MKLKPNLQKFKKYYGLHRSAMVCVMVLTVVLFIVLITIIFGFDQKILKTPFAGNVKNEDGQALTGVKISLQNQTVNTDGEGNFYFEDVAYGTYPILIQENGYTDLSTVVKLGRWNNYQEYVLKAQEYGILRVNFDYFGDEIEDLEVYLNTQELEVLEETTLAVETGRVLVGDYKLEVKSPFIVDIVEKIKIKPGTSEISLGLKPAGDISGEIFEYITEKKISNSKITVDYDGQTIDRTKDQLENGLVLEDLEMGKKVKIKVEKEGYLTKELGIEIKQGKNNLGKISLIPEGKILLVGKNTVFESDIDGGNKRNLVTANTTCNQPVRYSKRLLIVCGLNGYLIEEGKGFELIKKFNGVHTNATYLSDEDVMLIAEGNKLFKIGGKKEEYYSQEGNISSVVGDGERVFFSDQNGIYQLDVQKNKKKITNSSLYLKHIKGNKIIALSSNNSGSVNLWLIDVDKGNVEKLSVRSGNFSEPLLIEEDLWAYKVDGDLKTGGRNQRSLVSKISQFYPLRRWIIVEKENEFIIYDYEEQKFVTLSVTG